MLGLRMSPPFWVTALATVASSWVPIRIAMLSPKDSWKPPVSEFQAER